MQFSKASTFVITTFISIGLITPIFLHAEQEGLSVETAANVVQSVEPRRINTGEFVESEAGQLFQAGDYVRAVDAFDGLLKDYPDDPLIIRYKAMALTRLGQYAQAIKLFESLLDRDPVHVPTRYFLGQAYEASGNKEAAAKEWRWILDVEEKTAYQYWSSQSLNRVEGKQEKPAERKVPRWYVVGRYGFEYDSNVILKPDDKSVASAGDQNAGRHTFDLKIRYRAFSKRDQAIDVFYATRQSLNDDGLDEFNFHSEEFGAEYKKRVQVENKDVILGARYDLIAGFLDGETFSLRNKFSLTADSRLTTYTRTVAHSHSSFADFGNDGFSPGRVSRDGFYQDLGITHYFYSEDFRRFLFLKEEINAVSARGDNYDSFGLTSRIGFHTPLVNKFELDMSSGLVLGFYPHFSSATTRDSARRRDVHWDLYTGVTYKFTRAFGVRAFYRYINSQNQNNVFDYSRHIAGAQVIYSWFG